MLVKTLIPFLFFFLAPRTVETPKSTTFWELTEKVIKVVKTEIPKMPDFYQTLVNLGIKFPEVVMAQVLTECSYFESNLAKKHWNIFGMGVSKRKWATGKVWTLDMGGSWKASYPDWVACLNDYKEWQTSTSKKEQLLAECKSNEDYIVFLKKIGYATDPSYGKIVRQNIQILKERGVF